VFLEVNPAGEFFWLDRDGGLPISEAIADVMLGLAPRRMEPKGPAKIVGAAPASLGAQIRG